MALSRKRFLYKDYVIIFLSFNDFLCPLIKLLTLPFLNWSINWSYLVCVEMNWNKLGLSNQSLLPHRTSKFMSTHTYQQEMKIKLFFFFFSPSFTLVHRDVHTNVIGFTALAYVHCCLRYAYMCNNISYFN